MAGSCLVDRLSTRESEAELIRRGYKMLLRENATTYAIVKMLNQSGIRTAQGNEREHHVRAYDAHAPAQCRTVPPERRGCDQHGALAERRWRSELLAIVTRAE